MTEDEFKTADVSIPEWARATLQRMEACNTGNLAELLKHYRPPRRQTFQEIQEAFQQMGGVQIDDPS